MRLAAPWVFWLLSLWMAQPRTTVWAQGRAGAEPPPPTTLIFVNGIWNAPETSQQSADAIRRIATSAGFDFARDVAEPFYNTTATFSRPQLAQYVRELCSQLGLLSAPFSALLAGDWGAVGQLWSHIDECSVSLDDLGEATIQVVNLLFRPFSEAAEPDAARLAAVIRKWLVAGHHVILVPHSQGNLMVQQALRLYARDPPPLEEPRCIGVLSLAAPISQPFGDSPIREIMDAFDGFSIQHDLILAQGLNGLAQVPTAKGAMLLQHAFEGTLALPPKWPTISPWPRIYAELLLHNLVDSYALAPESSGRIESHLRRQRDLFANECPVAPLFVKGVQIRQAGSLRYSAEWADANSNDARPIRGWVEDAGSGGELDAGTEATVTIRFGPRRSVLERGVRVRRVEVVGLTKTIPVREVSYSEGVWTGTFKPTESARIVIDAVPERPAEQLNPPKWPEWKAIDRHPEDVAFVMHAPSTKWLWLDEGADENHSFTVERPEGGCDCSTIEEHSFFAVEGQTHRQHALSTLRIKRGELHDQGDRQVLTLTGSWDYSMTGHSEAMEFRSGCTPGHSWLRVRERFSVRLWGEIVFQGSDTTLTLLPDVAIPAGSGFLRPDGSRVSLDSAIYSTRGGQAPVCPSDERRAPGINVEQYDSSGPGCPTHTLWTPDESTLRCPIRLTLRDGVFQIKGPHAWVGRLPMFIQSRYSIKVNLRI